MKKWVCLWLLALCCMGADGCPLSGTSPEETDAKPSTPSATLDLGGTQGALWKVTFDSEVGVILRANGQSYSETIPLADGRLTLQGQTIDVANFCWRTDTICPHQVLPGDTMIIQGASSPRQILIGFNRRGPFSQLSKNVGLIGQLDDQSLYIPLAVGESSEGLCGLGKASAIMATAHAGENNDQYSTAIQGRVALVYTGICFNGGGSAAVKNSLELELSMQFAAQRQP